MARSSTAVSALNGLNKQQRAVVLHGVSKGTAAPAEALLVLAGAGTGKTKTLAAFAGHRVHLGTDPARVLVLAFNHSAAREIRQRIGKMTGKDDRRDQVQCGTFHAMALHFVRAHAPRLGLKPNFTIGDHQTLMEGVLAQRKLSTMAGFPDTPNCLRIYSYLANSLKSLEEVMPGRFGEYEALRPELAKVFEAYDQAKRANNVLDFNDLLTFWYRLLRLKKTGKRIRQKFDYVLVDEYQDTTPLQDRILKRLRPDGRGLILVGDDDQCIYGFLGATPANIMGRAKKTKLVKLTRSYRSTQPILDACNAVIDGSDQRIGKDLWSKTETGPKPKLVAVSNEWTQTAYVLGEVRQARDKGTLLSELAVLARTSEELDQIEAELNKTGIPYRRVGGDQFTEQPGVKAALAVLSWCENPSDTISATRAIQLVPGVSSVAATSVAASLKGKLGRKRIRRSRPAGVTKKHWAAFVDLVSGLDSELIDKQIEIVARYLQCDHSDSAFSHPAKNRLKKRAAAYLTRAEFLDSMSLREPALEAKVDRKDRLTISTIHSAKGQEWEAVFILNTVDECIPTMRATSFDAMDEERRVLFVGMTRAKQRLELIVPKRLRRVGNNSLSLARTTFIPKRLLKAFDEAGGRAVAAGR
jgi:DNA helicase II / ATP-dependent DNA helicase PcrA